MTDLIFAETIFVLESVYEVDRIDIREALQALITMQSVSVVDSSLLFRSLELYEEHRLDFAESYLVALAESTQVKAVASFDQSIDRVTTIKRIQP